MSTDVAVVKKTTEEEYTIKPQATTPSLDTSEWPLLLKNYEKRKSPDDLMRLQLLFDAFLSLNCSPDCKIQWLTRNLQNLQFSFALVTSLPSLMAALL
jgi:hypothetical protein